jgi:hypothetical protein
MNDSFNDMENEIRPPDEVIREQLIEDTRTDFEKEMDEAINLSMLDIIEKQNINFQYEEEILKQYNEESCKRKESFTKFLLDLNKLGKLDKEVGEIYEIIEPIVESYCSQFIQICELDYETHNKIFNLLGKIRTDKSAVEILKTIIIKE